MKTIPSVFFLLLLAVTSFSADRPNILFLAVDDLRPELACFGAETVTPNFDRLAASGIRFNRAYCNQAVCGASRLSIMGGLYPTKTHEHTFHVDGWRKRHPDLLTMQQHFGQQGYTTVGLGKIYHGTGGPGIDPEHWGQWIQPAGKGYALNESDRARQRNQKAHPGKDSSKYKGPSTELADVTDDVYADGQRALKGAQMLKELTGGDKPFFLAVGFTKPHLPFTAPKTYWDLYDRNSFSLPDNLGVPPGYPDYARNASAGELMRYSDIDGTPPTQFTKEINQRLLHGYSACVSFTDANLGTLLDALDQSGAAENTIVVLWGDHGWKLGDHSSWCKHTNFECDTRVPLFVRVPGGPQGAASDSLVELIDLYPTLCELTGLPIPEHVQGRSFAAVTEKPALPHREEAYSVYPHGQNMGHSIRIGDYRYTEWHDKKTGRRIDRVLTNLKMDPGETTNVLENPEHADALAIAEKRLAARIAEAIQ